MKKLLLLILPLLVSCLTFSMSLSAETLKTNDPNKYLKNYVCKNNTATYNAVNKSGRYWRYIEFVIYDADGDPIDNFSKSMGLIKPMSGKKDSFYGCNRLQNVRYTATVKDWL